MISRSTTTALPRPRRLPRLDPRHPRRRRPKPGPAPSTSPNPKPANYSEPRQCRDVARLVAPDVARQFDSSTHFSLSAGTSSHHRGGHLPDARPCALLTLLHVDDLPRIAVPPPPAPGACPLTRVQCSRHYAIVRVHRLVALLGSTRLVRGLLSAGAPLLRQLLRVARHLVIHANDSSSSLGTIVSRNSVSTASSIRAPDTVQHPFLAFVAIPVIDVRPEPSVPRRAAVPRSHAMAAAAADQQPAQQGWPFAAARLDSIAHPRHVLSLASPGLPVSLPRDVRPDARRRSSPTTDLGSRVSGRTQSDLSPST